MRLAAASVVVLLASGLQGCGTSSAFTDDMNAVCLRYDARARAINARTQDLEGRPRDAAFLRALAPLLADAVALNREVERATRGVTAPQDIDRRKRDEAADRIGDQAAILRRLEVAARAGDTAAFGRQQEGLKEAGIARQRAILETDADRCLY